MNNTFAQIIVFLCVLPVSALGQVPGDTAALHSVGGVITGYPRGKAVSIALYASAESFKARTWAFGKRIPAEEVTKDSIRYIFENVPAGTYMVAAFVDINDDGKLNAGMFGPSEPYQMYRPHQGMFAPDFDACSIPVVADVTNANIVVWRGP